VDEKLMTAYSFVAAEFPPLNSQRRAQVRPIENREITHMGLFTSDEKTAGASAHITIISEHLCVTGEISGPDNVYINGTFKGRIVTQGEVSIGPKGKVEAEIQTKSLLVSGYLEGSIECESMTIFPTGRAIGNLCTATLEMHPGGYYFGESSLRKVQHASATPADESKVAHLSVVATLPQPKESSSASAFASASEQKRERSKNGLVSHDKPDSAATGNAEESARTPQTSDANQNSAPVANDSSEPRRWHSSWGRR
jgi:cytoskeletal protein CcmA (bactofilin family)